MICVSRSFSGLSATPNLQMISQIHSLVTVIFKKKNDYYTKQIRNGGMALARLSGKFRQFYLLVEPTEETLLEDEEIKAIRKIFELLADEHILRTVCYLYSKECIPITAALISSGTGFDMREVDRCMKIICENNLAARIRIAGVEGEINAYAIRRESRAVPLLLFADEIAKGSPYPIFNMFDREKPLI